MSLTLYDANGDSMDLNFSDPGLKLNNVTFTEAVVKDGTWIFYKYESYNDKQDNKESWIRFLKPSKDKQSISDVNGSVYLLPQEPQGIVLFEHVYYGGQREKYGYDMNFPSGKPEGASSAIVIGGKFEVFVKPNFEGLSSILTEGRYPTTATMNIGNDRVRSIRKLQ